MTKYLLSFFALILSLNATIPDDISWQGVLTDESGNLLNGNYQITTKLYDSETGSTALWSETQTITIADGLANLTLGEDVSFDPIHFNEPLWLEITIGTGTPLTRIKFTAVPYAITAKNVEDESITYDKLQNATGVSGTLLKWNGSEWTEAAETDPVFGASASSGISGADITNWNEAFGWSDHSEAGYITSYTETDPVFGASASSGIAGADITNWNEAFGWGDHSEAGYLTEFDEEDPTWSGDAKANATIYRTGNTGIGTSSPNALLHTNGTDTGEGNILFEGEYKLSDPGDPPAEGRGTRMMWYPDKAAFRAGRVLSVNWDKDSIGNYSFATGFNTTASGTYSTAFGVYTSASGGGSTAMGSTTEASGNYSTAIGTYLDAPSYAETVIGVYSTRYTPVSESSFEPSDRLFVVANGTSTYARSNALTILKSGNTGIGSITPTALLHTRGTDTGEGNILFEGEYKLSDPGDPPAEGPGTRMMWYPDKAAFRVGKVSNTFWDKDSIGKSSFATGYSTTASGTNSTAFGYFTSASGGSSTAMGSRSVASGGSSTAMGYDTEASGWNSIAMGFHSIASGDYSFASGHYSLASGEYSTAMGYYTDATGDYSFASGKMAYASGIYSTAFGHETEATEFSATAMGYSSEASGQFSTAMGYNSKASGSYSTALGKSTSASEDNSTSMGNLSVASGPNSTAMGYDTEAAGDYSLATGRGTLASGHYSTAMGYYTDATGEYSTALGVLTYAEGENSTAMGRATEASGNYSTALGVYLYAKSSAEVAVGCYNTDYTPNSATEWNANDRIFVVGNGSGSTRSNALTILKNGKAGFGTDTPSEIVHISNEDGNAKLRIASEATSLSELNFYSGATYKGAIGFNNTSDYLYIYQGGNFYFKDGRMGFYNVSSPEYALDLPNSNITRGKGRAYAWLTYSDGRLKSNRENLSYGLNEIMQIEPVQYFHHFSQKDENGILEILNDGSNDFGFIAQDMYKIIPEMVSKPEDDTNELWGINYEKLTPVLVKAVQEQQAIIEQQQAEIDELKEKNNEIDELKRRLEEIEKLIK
jgi:hypothetical protein